MFNKLRKILTKDDIKIPEYQQVFNNVIGYNDIKLLLYKMITSKYTSSVLLTGPPASSKTVFLLELLDHFKGKAYFELLINSIMKVTLPTTDMEQAMNLGFKMTILESAKEEEFSSTKFFGDLTIKELSKICRPQERNELIKSLRNMVKNVNSVITYLSKQK